MGFLDNSGDIILDAVLTDLGRKRLAEGNGKFRIDKFAFGDDEINYRLYDKGNTSGSAYYDLSILQTPVLEAFTNNMSSMKSRLISYTSNDLLYLPVIMLNNGGFAAAYSSPNTHMILSDQTTVDYMIGASTTGSTSLQEGFLNGNNPVNGDGFIRSDQGLNTPALSSDEVIDPTLIETQYFIQIDNRLGNIRPLTANTSNAFTPTSVDDDNIATYIFTKNDGSGVVDEIGATNSATSVIQGPQGTYTKFKVASSLDLKTSAFLFDEIGTVGTAASAITNDGYTLDGSAGKTFKFIDSTIRISGVSTGYTLDVPVRFIKKTS